MMFYKHVKFCTADSTKQYTFLHSLLLDAKKMGKTVMSRNIKMGKPISNVIEIKKIYFEQKRSHHIAYKGTILI